MKIVLVTASAAMLTIAAPALAGGHNQNPAEARGMASFLATGGGGNNSIAKDLLGVSDINGGVARFVSDPKQVLGAKGNGGWGNIGSLATGPDGANVVDGALVLDEQAVSNRQGKGPSK